MEGSRGPVLRVRIGEDIFNLPSPVSSQRLNILSGNHFQQRSMYLVSDDASGRRVLWQDEDGNFDLVTRDHDPQVLYEVRGLHLSAATASSPTRPSRSPTVHPSTATDVGTPDSFLATAGSAPSPGVRYGHMYQQPDNVHSSPRHLGVRPPGVRAQQFGRRTRKAVTMLEYRDESAELIENCTVFIRITEDSCSLQNVADQVKNELQLIQTPKLLDRHYLPIRDTAVTSEYGFWLAARKISAVKEDDFLKWRGRKKTKKNRTATDELHEVLSQVKQQLENTPGATSPSTNRLICLICLDVVRLPLFVCSKCNQAIGCLQCCNRCSQCPHCRAELPDPIEGVRGLDSLLSAVGHPSSTEEELSEPLTQRVNESESQQNPPLIYQISDSNSDDDFQP
ncbi:uncharacterized protein [Ptychodera flava]|uniref:uncharacterized protein n=1 Tax=Ptychodera flava TaxID=63121 RepID=UPI00396A921C